ncbi:MAG: transcription antitermination factor NusB [Bacteroidales bacterium]|nr:transcription antitermination factor NusB [Bacteroidales bacterium]
MISRRLLRLKVMQILYSYYTQKNIDVKQIENELKLSVNKTYELYHILLSLIVAIKNYEQQRLELRERRYIKSTNPEDYSKNFINNRLILLIENNDQLFKFINGIKFNWNNYNEILHSFHEKLWKFKNFKDFLLIKNVNFKQEKKIVIDIYTKIIADDEDLEMFLEEQSLYWNDELELCISQIIKTLKKFTLDKGNENKLMNMFTCEEDKYFYLDLFNITISKQNEIISKLKKYIENWEIERIAVVDKIILELAVTEFFYFPDIPTKVTLNEYIEIAKHYGTEKSNIFINGILDKMLKEEKKLNNIKKSGKGLIGEI